MSPLFRQIFISTGSILITIANGMTLAYSAILLPQLEDENSTIHVNVEQASWIASISTLPMIFGCLITTFAIELCGRKKLLQMITVPYMLGWLTIGLANTFEIILIGRFITGLCVGISGPSMSIYVGETTAPKYRGFLLTTISGAIATGIFLTHLLGTYLSWHVVSYISISVPFLAVLFMAFSPESPAWLMNKGQIKEAEESFYWCRGYSSDSIQEFGAMMFEHTSVHHYDVKWVQIVRPEFWKPLLIMNIFATTTQFSGINAIVFYSVSIMENTIGTGLNEYTSMMIIDTVRIVTYIASCFLTYIYGRRPLVNLSTSGMAVCLFILSTFLYLTKLYPNLVNYSVIPLISLMGFVIFSTVGAVPLIWTMMGEVFPKNLRGVGSGICAAVNFTTTFLVIKLFPLMAIQMGYSGIFLFYGFAATAGFYFLYVMLPETKGKTLVQIEQYFKKPVNNDVKV